MPARRSWDGEVKRQVAARQKWQCARCDDLLQAAFEVDHCTALHDGGADCAETNAEALCATCHGEKSLAERVRYRARRREAVLAARAAAPFGEAPAPALAPPRPRKRVRAEVEEVDFLVENPFLRFAYVRV